MFKPTQFFSEVLTQLGGLGFALLMLFCVHDVQAQQLVFPNTGIRASDIANVKIYGALGGGGANPTRDDAPAIQRAINAALSGIGNGTVYFPPDTYNVNSTLVIPITAQYITFQGYGAQLQCKMNGDCISIGDLTTTNNHATAITLQGLLLTGNGANDTTQPLQNGIGIYSVLGLTLKDININNMPNIGVKAVKSTQAGSQFLNHVFFDHLTIRFTGFQAVSYCETGSACDDLTVVGSLFNNIGWQVTDVTRNSGAVFVNAFTTFIGFSEISAVQRQNGTQGYNVSIHLSGGSAHLSALHFENNGANQANSTDILLDAGTDGSTLTAINCQESQSTGVNTCLTIRSGGVTVAGLQQCSSASHTISTVVDAAAASATDTHITGLSNCTGATAPTTWFSTSGGTGTVFFKGMRLEYGNTPTVNTCGTSPSVVGTDQVGTITTGSTAITSCTLAFSHTLSAVPVCVPGDNLTTATIDVSAVSTTSVTFSTSIAITSQKIYYHCFGAT